MKFIFLIYDETTFLETCPAYDDFLDAYLKDEKVSIYNAGDTYEVGDEKMLSVLLAANDEQAVVTISIYRYTDREI